LALAVHGPLLLMQLPVNSYDANTHMFFASHYANHWFDPWNEKWYAGFSQTAYPPLAHQWIALLSNVFGLVLSYMLVQLAGVLLLTLGVYRFARLWVGEREAGYAAIGSVFLGSLAMIVYQAGQINTAIGAALTLNAMPYLYRWMREARFSALLKGVLVILSAAAVHHVTLVTMVLLGLPTAWLAIRTRDEDENNASLPGVVSRGAIFGALAALGIAIVLLPFWIALMQNPVRQVPIPHASRENYLLSLGSALNYWIIPYGALALAVPFIFVRGAGERRLRPLFFAWWVALLIGLGGTTPVARILFGRWFDVFTFERFTFISTLLALPIVGALCAELIKRFQKQALVGLWLAAVATFGVAAAWINAHPATDKNFEVGDVVAFLNRDGHENYRYITLGFGNKFSQVATHARAGSVDGDYNSARLLPEMTAFGAAKLDTAKHYGVAGMESLRAMLKHASNYGLRYIFVHDRYYEPLLAFAGWLPTETYNNGSIVLWTREGVPAAKKMELGPAPPRWQGLIWGILPVATSILAIIVVVFPARKRVKDTLEFPAAAGETVYLREAK
jgi:hypothetical protein